MAECTYCGCETTHQAGPTGTSERANRKWARIAKEHSPGCPWATTRGFPHLVKPTEAQLEAYGEQVLADVIADLNAN